MRRAAEAPRRLHYARRPRRHSHHLPRRRHRRQPRRRRHRRLRRLRLGLRLLLSLGLNLLRLRHGWAGSQQRAHPPPRPRTWRLLAGSPERAATPTPTRASARRQTCPSNRTVRGSKGGSRARRAQSRPAASRRRLVAAAHARRRPEEQEEQEEGQRQGGRRSERYGWKTSRASSVRESRETFDRFIIHAQAIKLYGSLTDNTREQEVLFHIALFISSKMLSRRPASPSKKALSTCARNGLGSTSSPSCSWASAASVMAKRTFAASACRCGS